MQTVYLKRFENIINSVIIDESGTVRGPVTTETGVKFLFFMPSNMEIPLVRTVFRYWKFDESEEEVYMVPGVPDRKKYVYAYMKSELHYIVKNIRVSNVHNNVNQVYVGVESIDDEIYQAYIGSHLDVSIHALRTAPTTFISTHKTVYVEHKDLPTSFFRDSSSQCNFDLVPRSPTEDWKTFAIKTRCQTRTGYRSDTVRSTYDDDIDVKFINALVVWLTSATLHGGISSTKRHIMLKEGRRTIKKDSGGCHVTLHKSKLYLQKGGAIDYGGVTFMSDVCIQFLSKYVFAEVYAINPDMEGIRVFFDEFNELSINANEQITVIYDFMGKTSTIFRMDTTIILTCAYIEKKLLQQPSYVLNEHELQCRSGFGHMISALKTSVRL